MVSGSYAINADGTATLGPDPIAVIAPSQGYLYDIEGSAGNTNLVIFMVEGIPISDRRRSCVSELPNQFASHHPGQSQNADTQQG